MRNLSRPSRLGRLRQLRYFRARISMHCTHWHRLANPGDFSTSLLARAFTQSEVNHYLTQFYPRALMRLEE